MGKRSVCSLADVHTSVRLARYRVYMSTTLAPVTSTRLPAETRAAVEAEARRRGVSLSKWLAEAAVLALDDDDEEADHGQARS